jgi:hypothetical protein
MIPDPVKIAWPWKYSLAHYTRNGHLRLPRRASCDHNPAQVYQHGQIGELDPVSVIRAHTAFFIPYQGKILYYAFFFSKPTLGTIRVPCYAQFGSNGHPDATWFE